MKFEKLHSGWKTTLICCLFILISNPFVHAQFGYSCLFNASGCDYTEDGGSGGSYNFIQLNNQNANITLPYCSTEDDIIDAFEGWLDNLIDPSTNCKRVKIEEVEGNDFIVGPLIDVTFLSGANSFMYEIGGNVNPHTNDIGFIRLPGTCGGSYKYELLIQGDCELGDGDPSPNNFVSASLILTVYSVPEPVVPESVTMSLCESDEAIMEAYELWVSQFDKGFVFDSDPESFCVRFGSQFCTDHEYFGVCDINVNYNIIRTPGFSPVLCDIGLSGEACFKDALLNAIRENERNCGTRITGRITNEITAGCSNKTASSYFELVAPTIIAYGPAPQSALPPCSSSRDIAAALKVWLDDFTYDIDDNLTNSSVASCEINEEFYINGSTTAVSRQEIMADHCSGGITVEYVAARDGCRGNRSNVVTASFVIDQPSILTQVASVCSNDPLGYSFETNIGNNDLHQYQIVDIISNGLINQTGNVEPGQTISQDGLMNDRWINNSDQTIELRYIVSPIFHCSQDQVCSGSQIEVSMLVRGRPRALIGHDKVIDDGEPLGLLLEFEGDISSGVAVDLYDVSFSGFSACNENFIDGIYLPGSLETLLSNTLTTGCSGNCSDEMVQVLITPMSDVCRGEEATFNITIKYVDDTPPSIQCPPEFSIDCLDDLLSCDPINVIVTDDCPNPMITCFDGPLVGNECSGTILRSYTATDAAGNSNFCTQLITVDDETNPVITCPENTTVYLEVNCLAGYDPEVAGMATATDNCAVPVISMIDELVQNTPCHGSSMVRRTWTATDACENSSECVQIITISDTIAPALFVPRDTTFYKSEACIVDYSPSQAGIATGEDACSDPVVTYIDRTMTGNPCGGSDLIERIWTATDNCGNTRSQIQMITVLDTTRPVVECLPNLNLYVDINCQVDTSVQATGMLLAMDACQMGSISRSDEVTIPCEGEMHIVRTWVARDACGNESTCTQYITVYDTIRPQISCSPDEDLGINPVVPDATPLDVIASDNCSIPQVTAQQGEVEIVDCYYSRLDTYIAIDACGNSSSCTRLLTWKVDLEPPILLNVPANTSVDCESPLPEVPTDVEAVDRCDADLRVSFKEVPGGTNCGGRFYERIWTAVDEAGNRTQEKQVIRLTDNVAPKLTVEDDTTIQFGNAIPEPWYEVSENCSRVDIDFSEMQENIASGTFTLLRTWTARDGCGNQSEATQRIEVIDDSPPEILLVNPMLAAMQHGGTMEMYGCDDPQVSMGDIVVADANPIIEVVTYDKLMVSHACDTWGYYRKWKCGYIATDGSGNETDLFFYVVQYDTTAPELLNVPPDVQLACGLPLVAPIADVAAVDDCGAGGASIALTERLIEHPEDTLMQMLLRTWTATDACGNSASAIQTISTCDLILADISATIGDCVWEDANGNGLQDSTEQGIDSVRLNLYWVRSDMSLMLVDSTYSRSMQGQSGQYLFEYIFPGTYQVEVVLPNAVKFTMGQQGHDANLDSDITSQAGMTDFIEIDSGSTYINVDAGLIPVHDPVDLVGEVDENDFDQTDHNVRVSLFPNPTHERAFISFSTRESMEVNILVVDQWGRTIQNRSQILPPGSHREIVELQDEPDGLYWVTVSLDNIRQTKSLVKFK